jgi:hypothetical protein
LRAVLHRHKGVGMRRTALLALIALSACTDSADRYPSLLPRAAETQSLAEPERPVVAATPDATLDARVAALTATLNSNAQRFTTAAQDAEAKVAVARGVKVGSEAWLDAQSALSVLGSFRAPTQNALAELESLAIERGRAGQVPYPALDAAIADANAKAEAQNSRIEALEAAVAG